MTALDGTMHVPGIGTVPKKKVAIGAAVVAAIVGYGYYRKRQGSGVPVGVADDGTGGGSGLDDTTPAGPGGPVNESGDPVPPQIIPSQSPGIVTNADWISAGSSLDLGGTDDAVQARALAKALGGTPMSQGEIEIFHEVVGIIGNPPQGFPPLKLTTATTPPGTPAPTVPHYVFEKHIPSVPVGARAFVKRFSSPRATAGQIEQALRNTVAHPNNADLRGYYYSHGGKFPAKHPVTLNVVKV